MKQIRISVCPVKRVVMVVLLLLTLSLAIGSRLLAAAGPAPAGQDALPAAPISPMSTASAAGEVSAVHGMLYYSTRNSYQEGLFRVDTLTGRATFVGLSGAIDGNVGLALGPDSSTLLGSRPAGVVRVGRDGAAPQTIGSLAVSGMAYFAGTGVLYASYGNAFFSVNPANGAKIADLTPAGFAVEGLAEDPGNNRVYGLGDSTFLVAYNIATDRWSTVMDTGQMWGDAGLAYDPVDNVLYAVAETSEYLHRIDLATGEITEVGLLDVDAVGRGGLAYVPAPLAFVAPRAADGTVHFYDRELRDLGGFGTGLTEIKGAASDGEHLHIVRRTSAIESEVVVYDLTGEFLRRFPVPTYADLGVEWVEGALAIYRSIVPEIAFVDPNGGEWIRSIPASADGIDLAYDGKALWQLTSTLLNRLDPATGTVQASFNASGFCTSSGKAGLAIVVPGDLRLLCTDGSWLDLVPSTGEPHGGGASPAANCRGLQAMPPTFVATDQGSEPDLVRTLDRNLLELGYFNVEGHWLRQIALHDGHIYVGTQEPSRVYTYSAQGIQLGWWSIGWQDLDYLQGMEAVEDELALMWEGSICFADPATGEYHRQIPRLEHTSALAYDGTLLWQLTPYVLHGTRPRDGSVARSVDSIAGGCTWGGTALAAGPRGQLVIGCQEGRWYKVNSLDGNTLARGSNGIRMDGLGSQSPHTYRVYLPLVRR